MSRQSKQIRHEEDPTRCDYNFKGYYLHEAIKRLLFMVEHAFL
jgi:hypothetical protein